MKINRYKVLAAWMGSALLCTACHTDDTPESYPPANQAMRLYSEVATADEEDGTEGNNPVFLFWNYGDWLGQAINPVPLHVKKPGQDLNTYKRPNTPYNTGELYPDGNRRVVATGYAPATLEPATRDDGTPDYEHLTIPKDGYCTTDVLTSITPLVASAALPFDRADGEPLRFMHALSKVTFSAKLAEDMGKFLKNVRIKLDPTLVPVAVQWDRTNYTYKPEPGTDENFSVNQPKDANSDYYQLTSENPLTIGTAYRQDLKLNTLLRNGQSLHVGARLGYNFTHKEFYWSVNGEYLYSPERQGWLRINVGNGNRIANSRIIDLLCKRLDALENKLS